MEQFRPATWGSVSRTFAKSMAWFIVVVSFVVGISIVTGMFLGMDKALMVVALSLVVLEIWFHIDWGRRDRSGLIQ